MKLIFLKPVFATIITAIVERIQKGGKLTPVSFCFIIKTRIVVKVKFKDCTDLQTFTGKGGVFAEDSKTVKYRILNILILQTD